MQVFTCWICVILAILKASEPFSVIENSQGQPGRVVPAQAVACKDLLEAAENK